MRKYQVSILKMLKRPDALDPFMIFALNLMTCVWLFLLLRQWWSDIYSTEPSTGTPRHQNFYVAPIYIITFLGTTRLANLSRHFQYNFCRFVYPVSAGVGMVVSMVPSCYLTARYVLEQIHYIVSIIVLIGLVVYSCAIYLLRFALANIEKKRQTLKTMNPVFGAMIGLILVVVLFNAFITDTLVPLFFR